MFEGGEAAWGCLLVCAREAAAQLEPNLPGHNYQNARGSVTRTKKRKKRGFFCGATGTLVQ